MIWITIKIQHPDYDPLQINFFYICGNYFEKEDFVSSVTHVARRGLQCLTV